MATLSISKVFILDKYFTELQKFWETERKLQDTCSSNEAVHLQQRLRSLSSELATLRNRLQPAEEPPLCKGHSVQDLIHLPGPLTEDAIVRALQGRFLAGDYHTNAGPVLVSVNAYRDLGNPLTLSSAAADRALQRIVQEAVRQQQETGYPQAVVLGGESGSGKTHASMQLLRHLFDVAGGGPETDAFKHLAAAFTVLRSLGGAATRHNSESSRIGHFVEVQVTDGALYRTKIHCYFLDQTRVARPPPGEANYHVFYQMLAGLGPEERARLSLEGAELRYLAYEGRRGRDPQRDAARFDAWKACLSVLGIPASDVVRVLAAVLLLGDVRFDADEDSGELKSAASLLGVSGAALRRGLTSRTQVVRGQTVRSTRDAAGASRARDALAKALYCRTVATIVRRANSLRRSGTLSSDSGESSSRGGAAALSALVRHTDGFIGILDMFGFERGRRLEHLCINLCAETLQHFYNTHVFKSSVESCREEGVHADLHVEYADNVPCIDLISSLRTGLLSLLDAECAARGSPDSYVRRARIQHRGCPRFSEESGDCGFAVAHFAGRVAYDATHFLDTNRDAVPDDVVCVFHKASCRFGFATHLFGGELSGAEPRGASFRISPHADPQKGDEPASTLTQDFHGRLDNLLRTLVHAKPHFVRCIRANEGERPGHWDRTAVVRQIRALQVLETVNLMAGGFPHRMRFRAFNARYRAIAPFKKLRRTDDAEDCKLILECFSAVAENCRVSNASTAWAVGKRHVFLSEGARQQLELLRVERRHNAAVLVQSVWRGWNFRRKRWHQRLVEPPPLPPSRPYTVTGNTKMGYPQTRVMKMNYPEDGGADVTLLKGEAVTVVRASPRRGHLVVEHQSRTIHVPYQFLELKAEGVHI